MLDRESLRSDLRYRMPPGPVSLQSGRRWSPLALLIAAVDRAVHDGEPNSADIAAILRGTVDEAELLAGIPCPALSQRYARHLLHAGDGYSVLAVVWRPGQMSSVHGHNTWCVFGVHRGSLTESLFRCGERGLQLVACRQHHPGAASHLPARAENIHRIANLGVETAISIHVYGARFDRLGHAVNRVWAD